jgi:hypothetical protein
MSPFGSIKDRTARYMLDGLEARGLVPEKVLVEPTSGNTGIALAALAVLAGTRLIATVPSGVPDEKKVLMRMLGAEVWETPDELCPVDNPRDAPPWRGRWQHRRRLRDAQPIRHLDNVAPTRRPDRRPGRRPGDRGVVAGLGIWEPSPGWDAI